MSEEKETIFEWATMKGDKLYFDKSAAADVEVFNSLEDMSKAYYTGEVDSEDYLSFTPGFGECKDLEDIDEFLIKYCKDENITEAYFEICWQRHCIYEINPETLELGEFLESSPKDVDRYSYKDGGIDYVDLLDEEEEEEDEE